MLQPGASTKRARTSAGNRLGTHSAGPARGARRRHSTQQLAASACPDCHASRAGPHRGCWPCTCRAAPSSATCAWRGATAAGPHSLHPTQQAASSSCPAAEPGHSASSQASAPARAGCECRTQQSASQDPFSWHAIAGARPSCEPATAISLRQCHVQCWASPDSRPPACCHGCAQIRRRIRSKPSSATSYDCPGPCPTACSHGLQECTAGCRASWQACSRPRHRPRRPCACSQPFSGAHDVAAFPGAPRARLHLQCAARGWPGRWVGSPMSWRAEPEPASAR